MLPPPRNTYTLPVAVVLDAAGEPMMKSAMPSLSRSPIATAYPKFSPAEAPLKVAVAVEPRSSAPDTPEPS